MQPNIPEPLKVEHEKLHIRLKKLIDAGKAVGEQARNVANILHPHFIKEEEYALPPLGLLVPISKGDLNFSKEEVIALTDRLKAEFEEMIEDHKNIVEALEKLREAAKTENNAEAETFVQDLIIHAKTEEEVLYPAAILVGEYLKRYSCQ